MKKIFAFLIFTLFLAGVVSLASPQTRPLQQSKQTVRLPRPHYHAEKGDPDWLRTAVQFHGHLGPAIVVGVRIGAAGLDAVQAQGYFDIEVTAQGPFAAPPKSCLLDGLQLSTGASLGKRNLHVVESEEYVVKMKNKRTGKTVEIRPTPELLKLMWSRLEAAKDEKHNHENDTHAQMHRVEALARQILDLPLEKIMTIE